MIISYAVLFHSGLSSVSKTSPAARIGPLRQWKIALSLAVVGALAAPFAFRTYKARPWYSVSVPLTAQEKEKLADQFLNSGKHCEDIAVFPDQPPEGAFFVPVGEDDFCYEIRVKLDRGATEEVRPDRSKYWMMNVGTAAATAVSLFGLTFLVPMLIRGVAFLARRYWRWLNA